MIAWTATEFRRAFSTSEFPADAPAIPRGVFMVEPEAFHVNPESALDNVYMDLENVADPERALSQSQDLASAIRGRGIEVVVFPGDSKAPDGVFPNNAFATIPGRLIIGSMWHPGRRLETSRSDIRNYFINGGYSVTDLSEQDCIAELTGPLIIDRARRIGFCGMSDRINQAGVEAMHAAFDLRLSFAFDLAQGEYHTNVVMMILAGRAVVLCPDSFVDEDVPLAISRAFPGRTLMLTQAEKNAFAGNCIALTDKDLFMSQTGFDALRDSSVQTLQSWGFELTTVELDEIEKAGGSLRCMVAEIF
ncbi:MAG: hypothetical protein ACI9H8_000481 [Lysobacterales bacterium]|jgi:hypothetical protein